MPKTPSRKPAKKPKIGRSRPTTVRQGSSSTPGTTRRARPDASALKTPMSERDVEKIVSILQETVDQITAAFERQLELLSKRMKAVERKLNEAAVALLQR